MYRTLCVLVLLTMQAGLAHCFSWDIVVAVKNRLEFYNEEKFTYSVTFTDVVVKGITYDPFHNRVLLRNSSSFLLSFDIATEKIETLLDFKPDININSFRCTYDPPTGLFFVSNLSKMYSYLIKPGFNREVDANLVMDLGRTSEFSDIAVDSCGGYIYFVSYPHHSMERAQLNGSGREVIERSDKWRYELTIDPQTRNMYWVEFEYESNQYFICSMDLNGKHRRTLYKYHGKFSTIRLPLLTVSNDYIYWIEPFPLSENSSIKFWKIPKNIPIGTYVEPKPVAIHSSDYWDFKYIAANYAIQEQPQGIPLCKALKRLLPDYSETNDSNSLNVSTGGSLLRVNETKVSVESRVSGDTCNVSVCHNYCLEGNCSVNADGHPKCRCNAGYKGVRCEVNACLTYCSHGGVCSLSEKNNPVCQCTAGYQGERCDVPDSLIKCSQTVSLLKDILNADLTSVTEGTGVKSTCASTVVYRSGACSE